MAEADAGLVTPQGSGIHRLNQMAGMQATLASGSGVGPFARMRAGAAIDSGAYIGNFVELKGAHVGQGGNVCHLSYLGDADVGDRANIGAGTITCNYSELLPSHCKCHCCMVAADGAHTEALLLASEYLLCKTDRAMQPEVSMTGCSS